MSKKSKLVLELLKPKAQPLGFTKEELEGVAEKIAANLSIGDDATDDALNEAAAKAVDAQMFYLELGQTQANRIIQKEKDKREQSKSEEERKAKEEAERKANEEARKRAEEEERKKADEEGYRKFIDSDWAKRMAKEKEELANQLKLQQEAAKKAQDDFKSFRAELDALKADKIKADREKKLGALLDGTGVFGERIKKNYARMKFDSDADFEEFVSGVKDDIKAFNQERADRGLEKLGAPAVGGGDESSKSEPMSDAEVDALAAIM